MVSLIILTFLRMPVFHFFFSITNLTYCTESNSNPSSNSGLKIFGVALAVVTSFFGITGPLERTACEAS